MRLAKVRSCLVAKSKNSTIPQKTRRRKYFLPPPLPLTLNPPHKIDLGFGGGAGRISVCANGTKIGAFRMFLRIFRYGLRWQDTALSSERPRRETGGINGGKLLDTGKG